MDSNNQLTRLRTKRLAVLIVDARMYTQKSIDECAAAMGVSLKQYQLYEQGLDAPSIPEVEALASFLDVPMAHFWGSQTLTQDNGE